MTTASKVNTAIDQDCHIDYFGLLQLLKLGKSESAYYNLPYTLLAGVDVASINIFKANNTALHHMPREADHEANAIEKVAIPAGYVMIMAGARPLHIKLRPSPFLFDYVPTSTFTLSYSHLT
jgi:hypothetical protein